MKSYNKQRLLSRQQRQYRQCVIFIVILGLLASSLVGLSLLAKVYNSDNIIETYLLSRSERSLYCNCSQSSLVTLNHGECFFDRPVCYPGFTGAQCETELKTETYRSHCPSDIYHIQWTDSLIKQITKNCSFSKAAQQEWQSSCLFLCFYHRLTGITQIPSILWHKSLNNELDYWKENPMLIEDRLYEHAEGFQGYTAVPLKLNSIIEIGAGPFTQVQYLLTPFRLINRITLIEPNALYYMKLNNCAYRGGHLRGYPVLIQAESIEVLIQKRREQKSISNSSTYYSALISINVVEHVRDALEYFRALYDLLENDGLLIFHERWYDTPQQGDCILQSPGHLHPIRISKWMIDQFLNQFEVTFINYNRTRRQMYSPCVEKGQQTNPMIVSGALRIPAKPTRNYSCTPGSHCSTRH